MSFPSLESPIVCLGKQLYACLEKLDAWLGNLAGDLGKLARVPLQARRVQGEVATRLWSSGR